MRMSHVFAFLLFAVVTSMAAASDQRGGTGGLSDLPAAAQSPISAALGRRTKAYAVRKEPRGLQAGNREQHLLSNFTASEVEVRSGPATWGLKLEGYGYGAAPRP